MLPFQTRRRKSSFLFPPPFPRRVWVLSRHIIGSARFLLRSRGPLSPKYSRLFSAIYSPSAFSSTLSSRVSPSPPPLELPGVGNISSLTGPHSNGQTAAPSWSPPGGLPRQRRRGEKNTIELLGFIWAPQH